MAGTKPLDKYPSFCFHRRSKFAEGERRVQDPSITRQDPIEDIAGLKKRIRDLEQSETELRQAAEHLQKSEKLLAAAFDINPDPITITDLSTQKIIHANRAMTQWTGYAHEEIIGSSTLELHLWVHPQDRGTLIHNLKSGETINNVEFVMKRKDGDVRNVLLAARLIEIRGGQYVLTLVQDITERKQVEKDREKIIIELQLALRDVKTLRGLLPICASCKRIRDDKGYWNRIESYITKHSDAEFSHGICPDCLKKLYPDVYENTQTDEKP